MYYLVAPQYTADTERKRALYTPSKEQEKDPEVIELIKKRAMTHA